MDIVIGATTSELLLEVGFVQETVSRAAKMLTKAKGKRFINLFQTTN